MLCLWSEYSLQGGQINDQMRKPAARTEVAGRPTVSYAKLPLSFEANQGQTDRNVKFLARGRGYGLFLTGDEAALALQKAEGRRRRASAKLEIRNSKGVFRDRLSPV
jgi:hypothetical protein